MQRARPVRAKLRETMEEFEKDIMAIVKSSVPEAEAAGRNTLIH